MGSPAIFAGKRSKLLSSKGLLYSNGSINDYNGDINYILNGHAEVNTAGWATYADAAQATPVNGTGGSANVTWTQTTTAPLDDLASFVFTKDAVNRQGQGASYDFTIDSASQAKVMTITFDYIIGSGTFTAGSKTTDSDIEVYIYDITNAVVIQPSTYKLYSNSSTVASQFIANFQTPYNSTSYRLIFHCATTSASAYTVKFDNVKVSPTQYTYGTPITDWSSFSMTIGATTTAPTRGTTTSEKAYWRRNGQNMEIMYSLQMSAAGSVGSGAYLFTLPSGYTMDTTQIKATTGASATAFGTVGSMIGTGTYATTTAGNTAFAGTLSALAYNTNQILFASNATITGPYATMYPVGSSNSIFGSAANFTFKVSVPITGWSSCVQMSDSTTQQVVTAIANGTPANVTSGNPIIYPTIVNDTIGSYNATTGRFTVPVAGYWQVSMAAAASVATTVPINIYKNAVQSLMIAITTTGNVSGFGMVYANAGDILDVRPVGSSITSFSATTNYNSISFTRVSGPASIAATDTVAASYYASANQSLTGGTTIINFDSKLRDTQGSVTTGASPSWKFTAPVAGQYVFNGTIQVNFSTAWANYYVNKNGAAYSKIGFFNAVGSGGINPCPALCGSIYLNAGDYINFLCDSTLTIIGGTTSGYYLSQMTITKVGTF